VRKDFWQLLDSLVSSSEVVIDRPKDSRHPRYPEFIYPLDYGYLKATTSSDGAEIDVWQGSQKTRKPDAVLCTVDALKKDSETKILLGCTEAEKQAILEFYGSSDDMAAVVLRRGDSRRQKAGQAVRNDC
jgi:inorganic pyrophosphatase